MTWTFRSPNSSTGESKQQHVLSYEAVMYHPEQIIELSTMISVLIAQSNFLIHVFYFPGQEGNPENAYKMYESFELWDI